MTHPSPKSAQWKELREKALAATQGEWVPFDAGPWGGQGAGLKIGENYEHWVVFGKRTEEPHVANSFFVAAANPQVVLELLDENARYRAALEVIAQKSGIHSCGLHGIEVTELTRQALKGEK